MAVGVETIRKSLPAWGSYEIVSPLPGGHRNIALLIELDGKPAVAKTTQRSPEAIDWLGPVLDRAELAGFRVPRYLSSLDGRRVVEGVTVETWLEGSVPVALDRQGALKTIREFHRLTQDVPQRPGFRSSLSLLQSDRGGDVDLTSMPSALVAACRSAWEKLRESDQSVVHGDLNPSNLLLDGNGRLALIDWDEARVDISRLDETALLSAGRLVEEASNSPAARALLAWEVAASWRLEPEYARRLSDELMRKMGARR